MNDFNNVIQTKHTKHCFCETAEPQLSKPVNRFEKQLPQKRMSGRNEKTLWYRTASSYAPKTEKPSQKAFSIVTIRLSILRPTRQNPTEEQARNRSL